MSAPAATGARDARLDFFRGLAMLIIYVAHMPRNDWILWIPARFGPSDAAEMFVFCSGFASALAFGGSFRRHGFGVGCLRIVNRCWQIYWCQFCLVLATTALLYAATTHLGTRDYLFELNIAAAPARAGPGAGRPAHAELRAELFRHPADVHRGAGADAGGDAAGEGRPAAGRRLLVGPMAPGLRHACRARPRNGGRTGGGSSIP